MTNKVLLDSIDEFVDIRQKQDIKNALEKCRYAKLTYNQIDFNLKADKVLNGLEQLTMIETKEPSNSKEAKLSDRIACKENLPNEIDQLLKRQEKLINPSTYYLNFQDLSTEDKEYIYLQDKKREEGLKSVLRKIRAKREEKVEFKTLADLKESQKLLREPFFIVKKYKHIQQTLSKEDVAKISELKSSLSNLLDKLKALSEKCESYDQARIFDENLTDQIRNNINDLKSVGEDKTVKQLIELESKYNKQTNELSSQIENKINDYQRAKAESELKKKLEEEEEFRKLQAEKMRQEEEKQRQKLQEQKRQEEELIRKQKEAYELKQKQEKFAQDIKSISRMFEDTKSLLNKLKQSLIARVESLKSLKLERHDLEQQVKLVTQEIDSVIKECDDKIQKIINIKIDQLKENEQIKLISDLTADVNKHVQAQANLDKKSKELDEAFRLILKENEKHNEKEEAIRREKEIQNQKAKEEQTKLQQKVDSINTNDKKGLNELTLKNYETVRQSFENLRRDIENCFNESSLKMYKFDLQKGINFPINSLLDDKTSEENRRQFAEKIRTLLKLLAGQTCTITTTLTVNPTKHPRAIEFCLVYLARKLVEKGEETVASRPESAFQYVQVIVHVLKQNTNFEPILMGQFQEKCPYIVPYYKTRQNGQTENQYYESLGYKIINGKIEEDVHFYKRMSGVCHLYFTYLISVDRAIDNKFHGLKKAWTWLSDVLNMTPRANITAEMLAIYFKCCGYQMQLTYGKQFRKLVKICHEDYLKLIESIPEDKQSGASVGRLKSVFEQYFKLNSNFVEWKNA